MVIPIPERIASQGPPTTTWGDHLWWEGRVTIMQNLGEPIPSFFLWKSSTLNAVDLCIFFLCF